VAEPSYTLWVLAAALMSMFCVLIAA